MSDQKTPRPLVKCPHCSYTCRGTQALGRHIHYSHPEKANRKGVEIKSETLNDLLQLVQGLMVKGRSGADKELHRELQKRNLELHLTLAVVATEKARRIAVLQAQLTKLDSVLLEKLTPEGLKELQPSVLAELRKSLQSDIVSDVNFLKSILSIRESNSSLVRLLEQSEVLTGTLVAGREREFRSLEFSGPRDEEFVKKLLLSLSSAQDPVVEVKTNVVTNAEEPRPDSDSG